jgi:pimeloyl-ACP methyl ester carboxylesterase
MSNPLLNYEHRGSGETLVIMHGLFGSLRNWQTLSKRLAENFSVITVDLRNHGDSFHDPQMDYRVMAGDIIRLLDHLELSSAHILGHSMGGKVAMTAANLNPQRVDKLIVADIAPVRYLHDYEHLIEPVMQLDLSSVRNRKQVDQELSDAITDVGLRQFMVQNLVIEQGQARWKTNWQAIKDNMKAIVGFESINNWQIHNPALFLRGADSNYVMDMSLQKIKRHFLNCQVITIEQAGHWLHAQQPEAFYQHVHRFLIGSHDK